ncbi:S-adenosyl-L-methionine-dependent methyltransferase [Podospora conica]|nr:S-adenosyl-L-methionine-dependent methyltransferase [Schizothecium conicum]
MAVPDADATGNDRFNAEALTWDQNPTVVQSGILARAAYLDRLPPPPELSTLSVLEIGCGTGLLSLSLAPLVHDLTAVDAAEGMISVLSSKLSSPDPVRSLSADAPIAGTSITNVLPVAALLTSPDDPRIQINPLTRQPTAGRRFDLVISHLVLHHVADLSALFATIIACLKPGGRVMVTDFEDFGPEAERFHPAASMDGVERHGIRREVMEALLAQAGFEEVSVETAFKLDKMVETVPGNGVMEHEMTFPFLICRGRRPLA